MFNTAAISNVVAKDTTVMQDSSKLSSVDDVLQQIDGSTDIISNISQNYNFLQQVMSGQVAVVSAQDTLDTQKASDDFSFEAELVSKVVSMGIQDINTLVKMQ